MSVVPVPSRSISTTIVDSLVMRSTRAVAVTVIAPSSIRLRRASSLTSQQYVVLGGQSDGGAQVSGDPDVADQHALVEVTPPGGGASANRPNSRKLASLGTTS